MPTTEELAQVAAPPAPEPVEEQTPAAAPSILDRVNPLRSLRKHHWMALTIFFLILGAGIPIAIVRGRPVYSSEAVVYISPRFLKNLQDDKEFEMQSNSQYREYVQQNVRTINRFDIVEEASRQSPEFLSAWKLPSESERLSLERLQGALAVVPVPDTYQVTVGLENSSQIGLADFINRLVAIYLKKAKSEEFYASDTRISSLRKEASELEASIEASQSKRMALAQEIGVSTFTDNYVNPYDHLLVAAKEALAEGRRKRMEADAKAQMLVAPVSSKERANVDAFALEMATRDAAMTTVLATLNTRRAELLSHGSGLGEKHPGYQAIKQEIGEIDAEKKKTLDGLASSYAKILLDEARAEATRAAQVERDLSGEVDEQQSRASWFTERYQQAIGEGLLVERSRKRLDTIDDRVRFLAQERQAPGFLRVFSEARTPERPVRGGKRKFLVLLGLAALFLATIIPVAADIMDPRVFSPSDAARTLKFAVTGWLPDRTEAGEAFWREQVLRLAHRIDQDRTAHGTCVWCFAGAQSDSGTREMVLALGSALRDLGITALTIEANASRGSSGAGRGGLTIALRGNTELLDHVEPAGDHLPDHLPVGPLDGSGHLPDVHRMVEVFREASGIYQVVLVELPPVLMSADTEYLASRVDVVVLVMEAAKLVRSDLARALETLEKNKPRAIAAVLNGVRLDDAGGFARAALKEFQSGEAAPAARWRSPWLWR